MRESRVNVCRSRKGEWEWDGACGMWWLFLSWLVSKETSSVWLGRPWVGNNGLWKNIEIKVPCSHYCRCPLDGKTWTPLPFLICFTYIVFILWGFWAFTPFWLLILQSRCLAGWLFGNAYSLWPTCTMTFISIIGHQLEEFYSSDEHL